jgi:predicted transcriptional regulator
MQKKKKHPMTIVLTDDTHKALSEMAKQESRPVAQMARVLIERAIKK